MTQAAYRYTVVDVFTLEPLEGNPLAVFPEASEFDEMTMQKIAKELNLAETAFVFPSTRKDCAARVRIFTPTKEMAFAGHPTIGTCFVLLNEGMISGAPDVFMLEEKVGPVPIRVERGCRPLIWLRTPTIVYGRKYDTAACAEMLGLSVNDLLEATPQFLSAGNPTIFVAVKNKNAVDRAQLDLRALTVLIGPDSEPLCVFVFAPTSEGAYSRMFAPLYGIPEDPATGSSTGPLASFMMSHDLITNAGNTRFVSEQGTKMGRRSVLHVEIHGKKGVDGIYVGGYVTPIVEAVMKLGSD